MFYSWEKQGPNLKQYLAVINRAGGLFERILTGDTLYTERGEAFYQLLARNHKAENLIILVFLIYSLNPLAGLLPSLVSSPNRTERTFVSMN